MGGPCKMMVSVPGHTSEKMSGNIIIIKDCVEKNSIFAGHNNIGNMPFPGTIFSGRRVKVSGCWSDE
jgi:hypothetical protein